jgi:uncharacterized protein (DUF1015 family)
MLREAFERVPVSYLTDGHHRVAAASRFVSTLRREGHAPSHDGAWNRMLVALFPHDELRVLPFNRVVRDLGSLDDRAFLERIAGLFEIEELDADPRNPPLPARAGSFVMVLDSRCFRISTAHSEHRSTDPTEFLDVSLLQRLVLDPILGISDSRSDSRLEYVSGSSGCAGVNRFRDAGWRLAFYCHPATVEDIMKVSDAGMVMPPKSTCFDPKVRSGLFLRLSREISHPVG